MARISKSQLIKLQKKYQTDEAIGRLFGISRQAVHQLREKYDIDPISEKYVRRNQEIINLYLNGLSGSRLSRKFKLSL